MKYLNILKNFADNASDRIAIVDKDGDRKTTFKEVYSNAKKVCRYLQERGIGKEKVVGIYCQKGMEYMTTRVGIMMAGAACVALEDLMGKERIEYVIKDCGCALIMDEEKWEDAMTCPECDSFNEPDPHDLALYIYTSGSTGRPKGVAQEYGVYDFIWEGTGKGFIFEYAYPDGPDGEPRPLQFAHLVPESFAGGVFVTIGFLGHGCTTHVVSWEITKNPLKLRKYFEQYGVDSCFMAPALLKIFMKTGIDFSKIRVIYTGADIVSGIDSSHCDVVNIFGSSEFAYPAFHFPVDKSYDITPIGYVTESTEVCLLNEAGEESDEGIICCYLPYFRGYHNLPEENRESFITLKGKKYYKSSDYACVDERGAYTILGRVDEMIKINGNRIELREVEAAVRKAFGVEDCVVKAFDKNGVPFLCAYYTGNTDIIASEAEAAMKKSVPSYMIPSNFVKLDEIPRNSNGKVNRTMLLRPDIEVSEAEYVEPKTDIQRKICNAFCVALKHSGKIGALDDFFLLGGDSIRAMEVILNCDIRELSVQDIYAGRCACQIEKLLAERSSEKKDTLPQDSFIIPVNTAQRYLIRTQMANPESAVINLPIRFKFKNSVDLEKLACAIETAINAHPALLGTIEETKDGFIHSFSADSKAKITPESMSLAELEEAANEFVRPFTFDGTPLFRCRLIDSGNTKEGFLDICHAICDGESYHKLIEDIGLALNGENIAFDDFIAISNEYVAFCNSDAFKKEMDYFRENYDRKNCATIPAPDHKDSSNKDDKIYVGFPFDSLSVDEFCQKHKISKNIFFTAAAALALAESRNTEDVIFSWTWNGKSDIRKINSVGCYIKDLPVAFHIPYGMPVGDLLDETKRQMRDGISHGHVSYWEEKGSYYGEDLMCLIYQKDIYDYGGYDDIVEKISEIPAQKTASINTMDVEILDSPEQFGIMVDYNSGVYEKSTIYSFTDLFCKSCEKIMK